MRYTNTEFIYKVTKSHFLQHLTILRYTFISIQYRYYHCYKLLETKILHNTYVQITYVIISIFLLYVVINIPLLQIFVNYDTREWNAGFILENLTWEVWFYLYFHERNNREINILRIIYFILYIVLYFIYYLLYFYYIFRYRN